MGVTITTGGPRMIGGPHEGIEDIGDVPLTNTDTVIDPLIITGMLKFEVN